MICINKDGWVEDVLIDGVVKYIPSDGPVMNEICTVIGESFCHLDGYPTYTLKEYSKGDPDGYDKAEFVPLDNFKEVTFTELKKEMPVSAQ